MKKLILMLMLCAPMTMMAQKFGKVNTQQIMQSLPDVAKTKRRVGSSPEAEGERPQVYAG